MTSMEDEKWVYWRNKSQRLEEENEKLKQEIDSLRRQLTVYRKIKRLVKDND